MASFQIPALENQHRPAESRSGVHQGVRRVRQDEVAGYRLFMGHRTNHIQGREIWHQVGGSGGKPARNAVGHAGESSQIFREGADHEQGESKYGRQQWRGEGGKQQPQSSDDQELEDDEIQRHQHPTVGGMEMLGNVEQGREHAESHEKSVDHQRPCQPEELADNKLPTLDGTGKNCVEGALVNLLGDEADANEDGNHHAKQRNRRQPKVDHHQAFYANGNLPHQNGRSGHQQGKRDQVIENAIAHRFAKSVGGDVYDSSAHRVTPATALFGCSLRTKYSSSEVRTGINEM